MTATLSPTSEQIDFLGAKGKRLLKAFCSFTMQYGCSKMRIQVIAQKLKISIRHVQRLIKEFKELGWLNVTPRPNNSSFISVVDSIIRFFFPSWKSYKQKPVHNPHLSTSCEQPNVTPMSPLVLEKITEDYMYSSSLINVDECLLEQAPIVNDSKKEKEAWQTTDNFKLLKKYLGPVCNYFDIPALKQLFALSPYEVVKLADQMLFVRSKNKGFLKTPSKLLMKLSNGILENKSIIPPKMENGSTVSLKCESELLQNFELLEEHQLMADQGTDGYHQIQDTSWIYHVTGIHLVFRNVDTDQIIDLKATSKTFNETVKKFWGKITQQKGGL